MSTIQIRRSYHKLTPTERKIAAFVLASPGRVISMSVSQLAKECDVAPSAVIRFSKSAGFAGFSELKLSLAGELGGRERENLVPDFQGDGTEAVVRKVFAAGIRTLKDTLDLLDYNVLEQMAGELARAKRIFVFGIGTSSVIATDAQYRLSQLGLWATACTDILMMNVTAVNLGEGDVVLAISHSGRTKAVVDAVRRAGNGGARTLAITSFSDSLLYRESDLAAFVYADEDHYPVEAVSARVAHTCLIDALTMILATSDREDYAGHVRARNRVLEEIRYDRREKNEK